MKIIRAYGCDRERFAKFIASLMCEAAPFFRIMPRLACAKTYSLSIIY